MADILRLAPRAQPVETWPPPPVRPGWHTEADTASTTGTAPRPPMSAVAEEHGPPTERDIAALRAQTARQISHWSAAVEGLARPDNFASPAAWASLESRLGVALRTELQRAVDRLRPKARALAVALAAAHSVDQVQDVRRAVMTLRHEYQRVETMADFYGDAVNTRTGERITALLRACDLLALRTMEPVLVPLGQPVPPVLCYLNEGLGASILRAGVRLWDPAAISPVAAVKITRHNLLRPTALIHETGHQVAFQLGWNEELARALREAAVSAGREVADAWAGWAQEIAADALAFAHTGFSALAALHDVIAGTPGSVTNMPPGDPHPPAYLRVLLGTAMCRDWYGAGPWDEMELAWLRSYPLDQVPAHRRDVIEASLPVLPRLARVCLREPAAAFKGRALASLVDPERVSPRSLEALARRGGQALYTSDYWMDAEPLRILALSCLRMSLGGPDTEHTRASFENWMTALGKRG
ncbi:hypothetical protein AB0L85_29290 [Streptomyces sp. NPDC052051]|uniref:hypothetical protein n=1 Tax=Streptomyces sp. NPDC052051 TaxID=3154649 RepID=UPI00342FD05C